MNDIEIFSSIVLLVSSTTSNQSVAFGAIMVGRHAGVTAVNERCTKPTTVEKHIKIRKILKNGYSSCTADL